MTNLTDDLMMDNDIQEMFNSISSSYDLINTIMTLGRDRSWRKLAAKMSGIERAGFGLDICCGTGKLTMEMGYLVGSAGMVIGLDFSEKMLSVAKRNIENYGLKDCVKLIHGDAMNLPLKDNTFDCVTIGWGLKNVPDILVAVKEMERVVKPGGRVLSLDMGQPRIPVFKDLYWLYVGKIVPALGNLWGGNKSAYKYFYRSSRLFPPPEGIKQIFIQAGLCEIKSRSIIHGAVNIIHGKKGYKR